MDDVQDVEARELRRLHALVNGLTPTAPPELRVIYRPVGADGVIEVPPARLALLPGSFNPPTIAHLALARAAVLAAQPDELWFALAVRTVDKERVTGLALEDRLLLLTRLAAAEPEHRLGVALFNRGLYVEQAEAVRRCLPEVRELTFVVGWDKIVQIFDPRYYTDREAALAHLFALARFLVAPRGAGDADELAGLLARPENAPYAARVALLPFDPALRDLSATAVRCMIAAGGDALDAVPPTVAAFIRETGVYAPETSEAGRRYRLRAAGLADPDERQLPSTRNGQTLDNIPGDR